MHTQVTAGRVGEGEVALSQAASPRRPALAVSDQVFRAAALACALLVLTVLVGILASMLYGGWPVFREFGLVDFVTGSTWDVNNDRYGAWPAIAGTLSTALIALVLGVPISLGIAVFLTQLSPPWLKRPIGTAVEILGAVPSIVYGMWGLFVLAPLVAAYVQVPLNRVVEGMPIVGTIPVLAGAVRNRHRDGRGYPGLHDHPADRLGDPRHVRPDPDRAARERVWHRLHDVGGG